MKLLDLIDARQSVRKYLNRPIEQEKLEVIIEAFRKAPSARNLQSWKLVLISDEETKRQLSKATNDNTSLIEAPVVLVGVGTDTSVMDCGHRVDTVNLSIAFSFAMLEACEQGLGTCWLGSYKEEKVKEILNIPLEYSVVVMTPLGYQSEDFEPKSRKDSAEIVVYDEF